MMTLPEATITRELHEGTLDSAGVPWSVVTRHGAAAVLQHGPFERACAPNAQSGPAPERPSGRVAPTRLPLHEQRGHRRPRASCRLGDVRWLHALAAVSRMPRRVFFPRFGVAPRRWCGSGRSSGGASARGRIPQRRGRPGSDNA